MVQSAAYTPDVLLEDFTQLHRVLAGFFAAVQPDAWDRPTERKPGAWTLHETLAHVTVAAELYQSAIDAALAAKPFEVPGLSEPRDLAGFNRREIDARKHLSPEVLIQTFLDALSATAQCASSLQPEQFAQPVRLAYMNRPLSVAELVGNQLAHPGITHGAQLANGAGVPPLWTHFAPDMLQRQITRFFCGQMSPAYVPEWGGDLKASINFRVDGHRWHLTMGRAGSTAGEGNLPRATLTTWTRNADLLCRLVTQQLNPTGAVLRGQMLAWGDLRLAFNLTSLFLGT